ncbi:hypothetical protein BAE44_0008673, partial [Dichanthelium oligosanthes]
LSTHFVLSDVLFVPRTCNQGANELFHSGLARDPNHPCIWSDPLPSFVRTLVDRDHADPLPVE